MFKISLLDVNIIPAIDWYDHYDQGFIYTKTIYPELFKNPKAEVTMVGKIDIDIIKSLIEDNNLINTLKWY